MSHEFLKSLNAADALEIAQAAIAWEEAYYREQSEPGIDDDPYGLKRPPLEEKTRLNTLVAKLTVEQMSELTALSWLGRKASEEELKDWDQLVQHARAQQNSSDNDTSYLCGKLPLGKYLMAGLEEVGVRASSSES